MKASRVLHEALRTLYTVKENSARAKSLFVAALVKELKSLEGDAEGRYRALMRALEAEPAMAADPDVARMRRDVIVVHGASLFWKAKRFLDKGLAAAAIEYFSRAHGLLTSHGGAFSFDKDAVVETARRMTLEMQAIPGPAKIVLSELRLKELRAMNQAAGLDESSKLASMLICQAAVYIEIAPYLVPAPRPSSKP